MVNRLKNNTLYPTFSEEEKQIYWNGYISDIDRGSPERLPLDLGEFRKQLGVEEDNLERFIPGIITFFENWTGDDYKIEDFFILDEQAQKSLGLWEDDNVKTSADNALDGELSITGIEISTKELVENIGDLYYDSLSDFLIEVSKYSGDNTVVGRLQEVSKHIAIAWEVCRPFGKNHPKHSDNIKGIDRRNEDVAQKIGELETTELKHFMKLLGEKIQRDGNSDKDRGRVKLSDALFSASELLK